MALTGKVALITCLSFIFSMSWLVSQVARPMVELRTPLIARGAETHPPAETYVSNGVEKELTVPSTPSDLKSRFSHASTLADVNRSQHSAEQALVVRNEDSTVFERELPPMYVPEAPIVVQASLPDIRIQEEVVDPSTEGTAAYATAAGNNALPEGPRSHHKLLIALKPEEATGAGMGWEISDSAAAPNQQTYTVQQGDTLHKIMKRAWQRTDPEAMKVLLAANPELVKRKNRIYPGEVLTLPNPGADASRIVLTKTDAAASPEPAAKSKASVAEEKLQRYSWYTIKKKDSLTGIARRVLNDPNRWREIAELNQMKGTDRLIPGAKIKLPLREDI